MKLNNDIQHNGTTSALLLQSDCCVQAKSECLNIPVLILDKKSVAVKRDGKPVESHISVNQQDGRIVFTELLSKKLGIEYGSTATFIFPKENNGELYLLIDDENGFMIRKQGKDRGSLLFANKVVAENIHRYFKSGKPSIKLSVFPQQILLNEKLCVWKIVCQRSANI